MLIYIIVSFNVVSLISHLLVVGGDKGHAMFCLEKREILKLILSSCLWVIHSCLLTEAVPTWVFRILVIGHISLMWKCTLTQVLQQCNSKDVWPGIFNKCENLFGWVMQHSVWAFYYFCSCFYVQVLVAMQPSCSEPKTVSGGLPVYNLWAENTFSSASHMTTPCIYRLTAVFFFGSTAKPGDNKRTFLEDMRS